MNLDHLQTRLWNLHANITEGNVSLEDAKDELHTLVNALEEITNKNDLWDYEN